MLRSRTTKTSLGVSFETYLRRWWDVQRDVVMISLQRLVAGWVVLYYYAKQKIKDDYAKERIKEDDLILRFFYVFVHLLLMLLQLILKKLKHF